MSQLTDLIGSDFSRSDLLSLAALAVAWLSAVYARRQSQEARRTNQITVHEARRPHRLAVYRALVQFSLYCSKYVTLNHIGEVSGSRELVSSIDRFKWEVAQEGELDMPEVDALVKQLVNQAWKIQRLIDRLEPEQVRADSTVDQLRALEDELHELHDWVGRQPSNIKTLFARYLGEASQETRPK